GTPQRKQRWRFWMIYQSEAQKGPEIRLEIASAEGIEAGKTLVKAREVEVGRVESLRLSDDFKKAIVTIQMNTAGAPLLRKDTEFWVVKPRIARDGVSGLGTLLSGAYIQLEPGAEPHNGEPKTNYVALEQPPLTSSDTAGLRVRLVSEVAGSLGVGDSVTFRGFPVGQVEEASFDPQQRI
ncbi:mammalian cell entry protein, partial [Thalassospira xiamenensis]